MPNVTADSAAVPKPKSSSSHAPNVTNSACAAAIRPSIPTTAAHPAASSRVAGAIGRRRRVVDGRLPIEAGQHDTRPSPPRRPRRRT